MALEDHEQIHGMQQLSPFSKQQMPGIAAVRTKRSFQPYVFGFSGQNERFLYKGTKKVDEPSLPRGSFFSDLGEVERPQKVSKTVLRIPKVRSPISDRTRSRRERINAGESLKTIIGKF